MRIVLLTSSCIKCAECLDMSACVRLPRLAAARLPASERGENTYSPSSRGIQSQSGTAKHPLEYIRLTFTQSAGRNIVFVPLELLIQRGET
jgi:hypothetical protein